MRGGVGIDLSDNKITVALLRGAKEVHLDTFVVESIPEPREDENKMQAAGRAIREIFSRHELHGYPVAACFDARHSILRELVLPFLQEDKIRRTISFEAEKYLHACAIEDVIVDFIKLDEVKNKSRVLLTAARKESIRALLDTLQGSGVDPEIIDLDVVCLFNAFERSPQFRKQGSVMVLDIGSESVRMLLVVDGVIRKVRSFWVRHEEGFESSSSGPGSSAENVEHDLEDRFAALDRELSRGEEEQQDEKGVPIALVADDDFKELEAQQAGEGGGEESSGENGETDNDGDNLALFRRIVGEAQRTFASVLYGRSLDTVCITGPGSRKAGAEEFFQDAFEAETETLQLDPVTGGAGSQGIEEAATERGAVALGLALRAAGKASFGLDYRKQEFRYEKRLMRLRVPLLVTGVLLFLGLFLNCVYLTLEKRSYRQSYENARAHQAVLYETTFEESPKPGAYIPYLVKNKRKLLEQKVGTGGSGIPEYKPVLDLFDDLGNAVRSAEVPDLRWMTVEIRTEVSERRGDDAGRIELLADTMSAVNEVQKAINQESEYFRAVRPRTTLDNASKRTSCKLELEFKSNIMDGGDGAGASGRYTASSLNRGRGRG